MKILCEISARHVHLCQGDLDMLFGNGAVLEVERMLSQPGQFLAKQRVTLSGPKRELENVAIIGPLRKVSQAEVSRTDCFTLGLKNVQVRQSGELDGTPGIILKNGGVELRLDKGVIIAKRHMHLDPETAEREGFSDGDLVDLVFDSERAGVLNDAVVRVDRSYSPTVHIDSDEGNAVLAGDTVLAVRVKNKK